jgi:hypothetical protein
MRNVYNILVGRPEGERSLGRPTRKWKGNVIIDLQDISWKIVDWIHLAQDRDRWWAVGYTVMNLRVP